MAKKDAKTILDEYVKKRDGANSSFGGGESSGNDPQSILNQYVQQRDNNKNAVFGYSPAQIGGASGSYNFDDGLIKAISDEFQSKWGDTYYYDMFDPEDFARSKSGAMPKHLEKKYNLNDPEDLWLYQNNLPYKSLFNDMASEHTRAQREETAYQEEFNSFRNDLFTTVAAAGDDYDAAFDETLYNLLIDPKYANVAKNFKGFGEEEDIPVEGTRDFYDYQWKAQKKTANVRDFSRDTLVADYEAERSKAAAQVNAQEWATTTDPAQKKQQIADKTRSLDELEAEIVQIKRGLSRDRARSLGKITPDMQEKIAQLEVLQQQQAQLQTDLEAVTGTERDQTQAAMAEIAKGAKGNAAKWSESVDSYWNANAKEENRERYASMLGAAYVANDAIDQIPEILRPNLEGTGFIEEMQELFQYATPEDIETFNRVLATDADTALAFYDAFTDELKYRAIDARGEAAKAAANENAVAASIETVFGEGLMGQAERAVEGVGNLIGGAFAEQLGIDTVDLMYNAEETQRADTIRDTVANSMSSDAMSFLYQSGMSIADSIARLPLGMGGAGKLASTIVGASASSSTIYDVLEEGGTLSQALWLGGIAGVAEGIFEDRALNDLLSAKLAGTLPAALRTIGKQVLSEGMEELETEAINILADVFIRADDSSIRRQVDELVAAGESEGMAIAKVLMRQLGGAFLGGALSGGVLGTGGQVLRYATSDTVTRQVAPIAPEVQAAFADDVHALGLTKEDTAAHIALMDKLTQNPTVPETAQGEEILNELVTRTKDLATKTKIAESEHAARQQKVINRQNAMYQSIMDARAEAETALANRDPKAHKAAAKKMRAAMQKYSDAVKVDQFNAAAETEKHEQKIEQTTREAQQIQQDVNAQIEQAAAVVAEEEAVVEAVAQAAEDDIVSMMFDAAAEPDAGTEFDVIDEMINGETATPARVTTTTDSGMEVRLHDHNDLSELGEDVNDKIKFAESIRMLGLTEVVVHDHLEENGKYDPKTNTIHIALDAESNLGVIAHELTHYIKRYAADQYGVLESFLKDQANKSRHNGWEALVKAKTAEYRETGMTDEEARAIGEAEAVAAMCEDMLRDEAKIREFVQKDMNLAQKVISFIDKVLQNFKTLLANDPKGSAATTLINDMEHARQLWFDALQAAKNNGSQNDGNPERTQELKRKYSPRPVEEMTRTEYNRYGWADVNNVLSKKEQARFLSMIGKKQIGEVFPTIFGDKYAIVVSDDSDTDSVLIVTDGKFSSPSIDLVLRSQQARNDQMEEIWRDIYSVFGLEGSAEAIASYFGTQVISAIGSDDVQDYEEFRRKFKGSNSSKTSYDNQSGRSRRSDVEEDGESGISEAPENGAFFNANENEWLSKRSKSEQETLASILDRLPTPKPLPDRIGNDDLPAAVESMERVVRVDEEGNETDLPEVAEYIAEAVRSNPMSAYKDAARNLDTFAKNDPKLRKTLRDLIERPFNSAGNAYAKNLEARASMFMNEMERLGIKTKAESAAVQRIGEGFYQDKDGTQQPYTVEMLQAEFPEKWENIIQAAELTRSIYDGYVDELNRMLEKIYPNVIDIAERDYKKIGSYVKEAENKVKNQQRYVAKIEAKIEDLETQLAGKKRTDTQAYVDLQNSIEHQKAKLRNADHLLELYQQKAAVRRVQQHDIEESVKNGEVLRNRRVEKRADYFHHFNEMDKGLEALMNILRTDANIDPQLAGKTSQTKPKTRWAGFMQRRGGGAYTEDAVNGMIKYMTLAEYKLAFDPLAEHLRNVEKNVRDAAGSDKKNANAFLTWLQEWRNGIIGKSSAFDRAVSDANLLGRKAIQVARWINGRVKSNTILGNARSALVQVSNVTNATTYVNNPIDWTNGMRCAAEMLIGKNREQMRDIMSQSAFMTQRYMDIPVFADDTSNAKKFALWMMEAGDKASAHLMWWSAYNQFVRDPSIGDSLGGGDYRSAVEYADEVVRRSVGGRGVGEMPTVMNSQLINMLAPFQVEVANTFNNVKEQIGKKNWAGLMAFEVTTFALNSMFQVIFNDRPLPFDFISVIISLIKDLGDEEEPWYSDVAAAGKNAFGQIAAGVPFATQLASSLLGDELSERIFGDEDPTRYGTGNLGFTNLAEGVVDIADFVKKFAAGEIESAEEAWDAALAASGVLNVALPWGGGQVAKTAKGVDAIVDRGKYTSDGRLQYPITEEDFWKTVLFGTSAAQPEGYDWQKDILSESKTESYQKMVDEGMDEDTVYDIMLSYKGSNKPQKALSVAQYAEDLTDDEFDLMMEVLEIDYKGKRDNYVEWAVKNGEKSLEQSRKKAEKGDLKQETLQDYEALFDEYFRQLGMVD